jgi:hypothetical protein
MVTIEKLIDEIIPYPADYSHRNGFSNNHIIDNLSADEKIEVENALIELMLPPHNIHPFTAGSSFWLLSGLR